MNPARCALMFSAVWGPWNNDATPCCISGLPIHRPNGNGIDGTVGVTTTLLVCPANSMASGWYNQPNAPKPCEKYTVPLGATDPFACVGKYQNAGAG